MEIFGIDVSHWNGDIDWDKVRSSGKEFAMMKCTESHDFLDNKFSANKSGARKAGLVCGYYHLLALTHCTLLC